MAHASAKFEFSLLGHKERTFDIRFSQDGSHLLTASQDGTARLFNISSRRCAAVMRHSAASEVLRAAFIGDTAVCTGGADGVAKIWSSASGVFVAAIDLPHGPEEQIYVCEQLGHPSSPSLLTASNDSLYVWDLEGSGRQPADLCCEKRSFVSSTSVYGGPRNPDNIAYIFDAKPCCLPAAASEVHRTIAVALSDGTVRVVDIRIRRDAQAWAVRAESTDGEPCPKRPRGVPAGSVPAADVVVSTTGDGDFAGRQSHVTSVCWAPDGLSLLAAMGGGDVAVIDTRQGLVRGRYSGCHKSTCYGVAPVRVGAGCGAHDYSGYMSWSSDGTVKLWNEVVAARGPSSFSSSVTLQIPSDDPESPYAIYSAASRWLPPSDAYPQETLLIALAGGSSSGPKFVGCPVHVLNLSKSLNNQTEISSA